jgi:hypothetical protein
LALPQPSKERRIVSLHQITDQGRWNSQNKVLPNKKDLVKHRIGRYVWVEPHLTHYLCKAQVKYFFEVVHIVRSLFSLYRQNAIEYYFITKSRYIEYYVLDVHTYNESNVLI